MCNWQSNVAYYYLGTGEGVHSWNIDGQLTQLQANLETFNRFNVNTSYRFNRSHRLTAGINNLFDVRCRQSLLLASK